MQRQRNGPAPAQKEKEVFAFRCSKGRHANGDEGASWDENKPPRTTSRCRHKEPYLTEKRRKRGVGADDLAREKKGVRRKIGENRGSRKPRAVVRPDKKKEERPVRKAA